MFAWTCVKILMLLFHVAGAEEELCSADPLHTCSTSAYTQADSIAIDYEQHALLFDFSNEVIDSYVSRHVPEFLMDYDWEALWTALGNALTESWRCMYAWIQFFHLVLLLLAQTLSVIVDALLPHMRSIAHYVSDVFLATEWYYQVALVVSTTLIVVSIRKGYVRKARIWYFCFVQSCRRRYRTFLASLNTQTRRLMLLLPHAFYITLTICLQSYAWTAVLHDELLTVILVILYPVYRSVRLIRRYRLSNALQERDKKSKTQPHARGMACGSASSISLLKKTATGMELQYILRFWVVWSFAICTYTIATLLIPSLLMSYITLSNFWLNMILLWLQLPITRGDSVIYYALITVFHPATVRNRYNSDQDGKNGSSAETNTERRLLLRTLMRLSIVPERYVTLMADLWSQGPLLGSLLFFFTPGFLTSRGCYLFAFGFPAYVIINSKDSHTYEWWVSYYCATATVEYLFFAIGRAFSWMPFFYHLKLLIFLWLEFPYFEGGKRVFEYFYTRVFVKEHQM